MKVRLAHLRPDFRAIFLFSGLRDGRASPYQLNGGTKWVRYFFLDVRDDISYVQILYNAKWSYLCISDISAVLGNNNQKQRIWFLDDNIWFDAVKLRKLFKKNKRDIFNGICHEGGVSSRVAKTLSVRQQCWPERFCKSGKFLRDVHYWLKNFRTLQYKIHR